MPAEMSALIEALAKVLGRKTSECEQLQQEIARLTERCAELKQQLAAKTIALNQAFAVIERCASITEKKE